MSQVRTDFLFIFNDRERADAGAEAARLLGYDVRVLPGDGEGRHFQVRLRLARTMPGDELAGVVEQQLRPLLARHRGRYEGTEVSHIE